MFGKDKTPKDSAKGASTDSAKGFTSTKRAPAPRSEATPAPKRNYIAAGTVVEGNIVSHEDLHLDGTVKGDIKTTAKLILGRDSVVEGNIKANEAEVAGRITGTVESLGLLAIRATCVIEGDIVTKSLNVESGSSFNGRCKVGEAAETDRPPVNRVKAVAPATPAVPAMS